MCVCRASLRPVLHSMRLSPHTSTSTSAHPSSFTTTHPSLAAPVTVVVERCVLGEEGEVVVSVLSPGEWAISKLSSTTQQHRLGFASQTCATPSAGAQTHTRSIFLHSHAQTLLTSFLACHIYRHVGVGCVVVIRSEALGHCQGCMILIHCSFVGLCLFAGCFLCLSPLRLLLLLLLQVTEREIVAW